MIKFSKRCLYLLTLSLFVFSCSSDDDHHPIDDTVSFERGLLITHEGQFTDGHGTVSYVSNDRSRVEHDIFKMVNGRTLGSVVQSMAVHKDYAYIIVNGSNQIEVVDRFTFKSIATIESGLSNPRYMAVANGKGYVTNWGDFSVADDDYVAVIDLNSNTVDKKIPSSYLPEEIVAQENRVFVTTGAFDNGDKIDVINATTDEVEKIITVGDGPRAPLFDKDGHLWVLTSSHLSQIDTSTMEVEATIAYPDAVEQASYLSYDNGQMYFYDSGSIYHFTPSADEISASPILTGQSFYHMTVKDGSLYGLDAKNFMSKGALQIFDLSSMQKTSDIELNIIPGKIYFN